jgi:very-short-patch-repair endonuclease
VDDQLDACEVVRRFGGVASWQQIIRHSSRHSVRRAFASGELRRIALGTYALPELPSAERAAATVHGLISHGSAARHWLLESMTADTTVHVTVPRHGRSRLMRGVRMYFSDVPAGDDHGGVTSPLRTVIDCAATLPFGDALAIADSALRRDLITPDELISAAHERRGQRRRQVLRIAEVADARADNPFESGLRAIVLDARINGFEPQLEVVTPALTARVDLGDPNRRIALEAESFTYHGTRDALVRDCRRYNELAGCGWRVLRYAWEHVMFDARWVAETVSRTCRLPHASSPRSDKRAR